MKFKTKRTGIYKITSPTGKVYIGQSRHLESRKYGYSKLSEEHRRKISNSNKGRIASNKGVKWNKESIEKRTATRKLNRLKKIYGT